MRTPLYRTLEVDFLPAELGQKTIKRFNIQADFHFAAHAYVGESVQHPRKCFDNNVSKTLALLDELLVVGVNKFIFSSSCATYGIPRGQPIAEDHPPNPDQTVWRMDMR
jgi:UDP-glucose 4-epimerase